MKVHLLGQENSNPLTIDGSNVSGIVGMLEKFLKEYQQHPDWKYQPILITFDPLEDQVMEGALAFKGEDESILEYNLRILDMVTNKINKSKHLIGGFTAVFISEVVNGVSQARKVGVVYYEFPYLTCTVDGYKRPASPDYTIILGRIVPPSA